MVKIFVGMLPHTEQSPVIFLCNNFFWFAPKFDFKTLSRYSSFSLSTSIDLIVGFNYDSPKHCLTHLIGLRPAMYLLP